MRKTAKGRGHQHPCPSIPSVLLKGHNSCWASYCACRWVQLPEEPLISHIQGLGRSLIFSLHHSELTAEFRKK